MSMFRIWHHRSPATLGLVLAVTVLAPAAQAQSPFLFIKTFTDDPVAPGGTVDLEFSITNLNRDDPATAITFSDDLDATLSGLTAVGLPTNNVCGAGSTLSGTSPITLTGGNLPAEGTCVFSVTLQVPPGAAAGSYPNTTSSISGTVGGVPVTGPTASDTLVVETAPLLAKSFTDDPVTPGGTVTLEFTVTNTDPAAGATGITFTDDLNAASAGLAAMGLPANDICGAGSQIAGTTLLSFTGGNLGPGASCTFPVTLQVPGGTAAGTYFNLTSSVTGTVGGTPRTGDPAMDTLLVVGAPLLFKDFVDDPVAPGGTVTLRFTLEYGKGAPAGGTDIAFSDDLTAVLAGLTAVGLPANDVCGTGSQIAGTTLLNFTGGSLPAGSSCTFEVTLQVPAGTAPGSYLNTTSDVTATSGGVPVSGSGASDTLQVSSLGFAKSFTDDPTLPGDTVTLEFTITNASAAAATGITFTDDLDATLAGLTAVGLPVSDICGLGSEISGTSLLTLTGGNLAPGASCTFGATLQVPAAASVGDHVNFTSDLAADVGGTPETVPRATDTLTVTVPLSLAKSFTDDPAVPGGTVTLEFTITNADPAQTATGITFTDDLDATLAGLAATGLPANDVCGTGSQLAGTSLLTLTGGNLAPGASCTFGVTLQMPVGVPAGTVATNTTSSVSGSIGALLVTGAPASDGLFIELVDFTKAFAGPVAPGTPTTLTFTLDNLSGGRGVVGLTFTDDLDATLPGLTATGLPTNDVCGAGSQLTGTSLLTLANGTLGPGASCTFTVDLQVPPGAASGDHLNVTSELSQAGAPAAAATTATLTVVGQAPPAFSKAFVPGTVNLGGTSTLTFLIDSTGSLVPATGLDFTDNLPAGVVVAAPPNGSTSCTGGTLTAVAGSSFVSYTGGTVPADSLCTVQVDVASAVPGTHVNVSGDLTSSLGNSGTATATLTVLESLVAIPAATAPGLVLLAGLLTFLGLRRMRRR
jgi:uncharacterized repeat protein (TIGR01451 family)